MRAALAVIAVIIILILIPTMLIGINSAQTDSRADAFTGVTTGVGVNEADVVLVADPFNDNILNVTSIVSNNASDAPLVDSYVTSTNTLTIRGLAENDTRTLTVTYDYASLEGTAASVGNFLDMMPLLVGIAAVVILVGAGFAVYKGRNG